MMFYFLGANLESNLEAFTQNKIFYILTISESYVTWQNFEFLKIRF